MSTFIYPGHFGANYTAVVGIQPPSEPRLGTMSWPYTFLTIFLILSNLPLPLHKALDAVAKYLSTQWWNIVRRKGADQCISKCQADQTLGRPEQEGFLPNQVTSHTITTTDGEKLQSWLILPLGAYTAQESVLTRSWSVEESKEIAVQIVRSDPQAVLVLYLHGHGSNLSLADRCAAYRNFSSIASKHIYLLSFNHRGGAQSDGSFTERRLVDDALSVLSWIDKKLTVPKSRVLLVGHGMGCEVAVEAALGVAEKDRYAEYAGLLLCACFTDNIKPAVESQPKRIAAVHEFFTRNTSEKSVMPREEVVQTWKIEQRLKALVRRCEILRISILQAEDDDCIPYSVAENLYRGCLSEIGKTDLTVETEASLGAAGVLKEFRGGDKIVRRVLLRHGGHNNLMRWSTVAFEAARLLTAAGAID